MKKKKIKPYILDIRFMSSFEKVMFIHHVRKSIAWARYDLKTKNGMFTSITFHDPEDLIMLKFRGLVPKNWMTLAWSDSVGTIIWKMPVIYR